MDLPNPDHALWTDFKHVKLELDAVLCYQPGASGHWLGGMMVGGWDDVNHKINEYASSLGWLELDNHSVHPDHFGDVRDCDLLHGIAKTLSTKLADMQSVGVAMGHEPPLVTFNTLDFSTRELIVIGASAQDHWFVEALRLYKQEFNTSYDKRSFLIPSIIQRNRFGSNINVTEYKLMCRNIAQNTTVSINNTPLSWKYYLDCRADDHDPCDLSVFHQWIGQQWFKTHSWQHWTCDYYQQSRAWCRNRVETYTDINYSDLFFDLQRPSQGRLANIDLFAVADYSQRNLDCVRQLYELAPPEHKSEIVGQIRKLKQQLARARDRL
jgi:hypothetical protein